MVMTAVQLEFVKSTLQYKIMRGVYNDYSEVNPVDMDIYNPFDTLPHSYNDYIHEYNEYTDKNEKRLRLF